MYRVQTACGRSATLTGDHNLWVLRDGQLQLIRTADTRTTDYIPVPEQLLSKGAISSVDTLAVLSGKRLFVEAPQAILTYVSEQGSAEFSNALVEQGIKSPGSKLSAIRSHKRGRGIEVETFQHLLEKTDHLGGHWNPDNATVGGKARHNRLPVKLTLTPELLRFIGYYIAEGNHQRGYVIIANRSRSVRHDIECALAQLGIPFGVRPSSDYQISSTALAELLTRLCGSTAHTKHLPEFWSQLANDELALLLRAYFDGDGTVGHASDIASMTASSQLASDLTYALLQFGIWARISRRWKRATNSNHAGDWYYQITISGQDNLRKFQNHVGFSLPHKAQALQEQLQHREHSNVDVVPINGTQIRWLRTSLGLTAKQTGQKCGLSRSAVQLFETAKRFPRRATLRRLLDGLQAEAVDSVSLPENWW